MHSDDRTDSLAAASGLQRPTDRKQVNLPGLILSGNLHCSFNPPANVRRCFAKVAFRCLAGLS